MIVSVISAQTERVDVDRPDPGSSSPGDVGRRGVADVDHLGRREIVDRVRQDFDAVLVHGDPAFIPLDASFPEAAEIADRLIYTGYVCDEDGRAPAQVAVGGGGGTRCIDQSVSPFLGASRRQRGAVRCSSRGRPSSVAKPTATAARMNVPA